MARLICSQCAREFEHPKRPGRRPSRCPGCQVGKGALPVQPVVGSPVLEAPAPRRSHATNDDQRVAESWRNQYVDLLAEVGSGPMPGSAARLPWEP